MVTFSEAGGKNGMLFNARMWLLAPLAKKQEGGSGPRGCCVSDTVPRGKSSLQITDHPADFFFF